LKNPELPGKFVSAFSRLHRWVYNKWYVDELYDALVRQPAPRSFGTFCWKGFDLKVVDGIVNGTGKVVNALCHGAALHPERLDSQLRPDHGARHGGHGGDLHPAMMNHTVHAIEIKGAQTHE
ncbi:MAG: hypothetical protein MZV64_15610, partial [Ignavibacteriales bacterium]|nr:hypothetical protein [Ignavibacteriales bacterium]